MAKNGQALVDTERMSRFIDLFVKKEFYKIIYILDPNKILQDDQNNLYNILKNNYTGDYNFLNRCIFITMNLNSLIKFLEKRGVKTGRTTKMNRSNQ